MSQVSNRFYVEAIDDGSTLHGQLLSTKSLTQAWTGTTAVPNWTVAGNQPTIYVDLLSGSSKVTPDAGGTWYYNGAEIEWSGTGATAKSTDGLFQKVADYPTSASPVPAIRIVGNLASAGNVNTDSISYSGTYTLGGSPIGFSVSTLVRITGVSSSGIVGLIEFVGSNVVTEKNQTLTMYGRLFDAGGNEITATATGSPFSTKWKLNNGTAVNGKDVTIGGTTYRNAYQVGEADITDNCVVECAFSYDKTVDGTSTTLTYSDFANIDDQTDPEQMYIQYNGGNDTGATLKKGGSVTWDIWMGTQDDATPDTSWTDFYVKLLNSAGSVVTDTITGIPAAITSGDYKDYRKLPWDGSKASITVTYDIVSGSLFNKYLTGIVLAVKS